MEDAVEILAIMGYNVVEMINPITNKSDFYIISVFDPSNDLGAKVIMEHHLRGKKVTKLISEGSTLLNINSYRINELGIRTKIDATPEIDLKFSPHFLWKLYSIR